MVGVAVAMMISTRQMTLSPTLEKKQRPPSDIFMKNVLFDWFIRYVCTRELLHSDYRDISVRIYIYKTTRCASNVFFDVQTDTWLLLQ